MRNAWGSKDLVVSGRPMSFEEIQSLTKDGLWTIGAHTVTHPPLSDINSREADYEIGQSRRACAAISGLPVESFAYPFGSFDARTCELVQEAGFGYACSTIQSAVVSSSRAFSLPRLQVPDVDGDAFEHWLAGWAR